MAWAFLTEAMLEQAHALREDNEGIVNYLLEIEGVQFAALANERGSQTKLSLRSRPPLDVATAVAVPLGGGGHDCAAGATVELPMEDEGAGKRVPQGAGRGPETGFVKARSRAIFNGNGAQGDMNGFLNVYKPTGRTSSDLVVFVRKRLPRGTAVGHGGTLDPEASGVLPVCVGSATRLFDYIIDKQKTYVARLKLGVETDTQDATGQVVADRPVTVGEAEVRAALPRFIGEIEQVPPMYSAIKRDGQRLYKLARRGETVALAPRPCRVDDIRYLGRRTATSTCWRSTAARACTSARCATTSAGRWAAAATC